MRFRAKLLICLTGLVLLTLAGMMLPLTRALHDSFDRLAAENFQATRHSVAALRAERVARLKQAGNLIMMSPDLRQLIADSTAELSRDKIASLEDRLDDLLVMVDGRCAAVVDAQGSLIAQTKNSPWGTAGDLRSYVTSNAQARVLVTSALRRGAETPDGMWVYGGRLFQVVAVPLVFGGKGERPDGALLIVSQWTDAMFTDLARAHGCEVSIFSGSALLASSVSGRERARLAEQLASQSWPHDVAFQTSPARDSPAWLQTVMDPGTNGVVGEMLIQDDTQEAVAVRHRAVAIMSAIAGSALVASICVALYLSGRLTRPVRLLSEGVARVAAGDLSASLPVTRTDELGQLGTAFNHMVIQLRAQRELQQLVAETQAATKAKSQFLANMSHEIRTPLHGVIGMLNLMLKTVLDDRQKRLASLAKSSANVLSTLINDILDLSKIESGKLDLESVDIDLHTLVEDIVELLSEKAYGKGIEIFADITPDAPRWVKGDPTRLRQVLINLTGNGVKFTERGAVTVRVTAERFEVRDTGIGIPKDRMNRLFQTFSQVDASTTRKFGGTGLGLAISKQLVGAMSGTIGVESVEGEGSTFWFSIPLPEGKASNVTPDMSRLDGKSVLLVGLPEPLAFHLTRQLATLGAALATEYGPRADFAIGTLGFASPAGTPRLLLATNESALSHAQAQAQGYVAVVTKPVRPAQLAEAFVWAVTPLTSPVPGCVEGVPDSSFSSPTPAPPSPMHAARELGRGGTPTPRKARNGYTLLIAEDTEANQIVAEEILTEEGYDVRIVADGQAAVDAHAQGGIDLILMDCQMPVLDGFEATMAIRAREPAGTRLPILALTANASGADRGRCAAAGMDGYCSKPFEPTELFGVLARYLPVRAPAMGISTSDNGLPGSRLLPDIPRPEPETTDAHIDLPAMLRRCNSKPSLACAVLAKFDKQGQEAAMKMRQHLADGDLEGMAKTAHALKGTAGVICAEALRANAAQLEAIVRSGGGPEVPTLVNTLQSTLAATLASASRLASELRVPAPTRLAS